MNGKLDVIMIIVHCIFFWVLIIFVIELKICSAGCQGNLNRTVTSEDNTEFLTNLKNKSLANTQTPTQ